LAFILAVPLCLKFKMFVEELLETINVQSCDLNVVLIDSASEKWKNKTEETGGVSE